MNTSEIYWNLLCNLSPEDTIIFLKDDYAELRTRNQNIHAIFPDENFTLSEEPVEIKLMFLSFVSLFMEDQEAEVAK